MAHSAHKDKEQMKERYDLKEEFEKKMDILADLVKESKHLVFFTGAGISTSTGIPDFRGPQGVWTLKAQGKQPSQQRTDSLCAIPSLTHRGILQLQNENICKYLISQNCDGLHRRSGIKPEKISELHGNGNIEYCESCGFEYLRDFHCYRLVRGSRDHFTGRFCIQPKNLSGEICNGRLMNSTIDFGQNLPEKPLKLAKFHSKLSDLHIVMGSSLTVSPACNMPELSATFSSDRKPNAGKLVICNLQNTPLDSLAYLRIYEKCDKIMESLMKRLKIEIPPFLLSRYCKLKLHLKNNQWEISIAGIEKGTTLGFEIPASIFKNVQLIFADKKSQTKRKIDLDEGKEGKAKSNFNFKFSREKNKIGDLEISFLLYFMGHYNEPPLSIPFPIMDDHLFDDRSFDMHKRNEEIPLVEMKYEMTFNPLADQHHHHWSLHLISSSSSPSNNNNNNNNNKINNNDNKNDEKEEEIFVDITKKTIKLTNEIITNKNNNNEMINTTWMTSSLCRNSKNEQIILMIGGSLPSSSDRSNRRPIHQFNLKTLKWDHNIKLNLDLSEISSHPFVDQNRWGHSATLVNDHLIYLIGGFDNQSQYNDVHVINSIDFTIEKVKTSGEKPIFRAHHSSTFVPSINSILLFAGANCNNGPYSFFSDLFQLSLSSFHWSKLTSDPFTNDDDDEDELMADLSAKENEFYPSKRSQHTSLLINDHEIAIMGGIDESGSLLNDIWIFNVLSNDWRKLSTVLPIQNIQLEPRKFRVNPVRPSATFVDVSLENSSKSFILYSSFDGVYLIDPTVDQLQREIGGEEEWKIVKISEEIKRSCHSVVHSKSTSYLIGGVSFDISNEKSNDYSSFIKHQYHPNITSLNLFIK